MSTLCSSVCEIQKKIKILRDIEQTTQENHIKGTTQLTDLQKSVNFVNEKFQEYKQDW